MENQKKCILPMNDISATIFYNVRMIISTPMKTPITWKCSKVETTSPKGIVHFTFAQDSWDEHKDVFEYEDGTTSAIYDANKKLIGMYADYWDNELKPFDPEEEIITKIYSKIGFAGAEPDIKVGGSFKKFYVQFYDGDSEIPVQKGIWKFSINGQDAEDLLKITPLEDGQIKIKFIGDGLYIGKTLVLEYISELGVKSSLDVEIIGL